MTAGVIAAHYVDAGASYTHPNIRGWWKADAIVGLADGDPITTWPSSAANNGGAPTPQMEQTITPSERPIYKVNIRNGRPVVRFNTTANILSSPRQCTAVTMSVAVKLTNAGVTNMVYYNGTSSRGGGPVSSGGNRGAYARAVAFNADGAATTNWERWVICMNSVSGSGSMRMFVNGTKVVDLTGVFNAVNSDLGTHAFGRDDATNRTGGMDLGEGLIHNVALTDGEVATLDAYLAARWG